MWFDEPEQGFVPMASELRVVLGVSGLFTLFYVLIAGPMSDIATNAARTFF
jgi:NADH-quinone oxidoreductase subunit N